MPAPALIIRGSMTSSPDSFDDDGMSEDSAAAIPDNTKQKWKPTQRSLNNFLNRLDPDPEKAGKEYERLRTRLIRFFEWRRCDLPDARADQTLDTGIRKLDKGQDISNLKGFVFAIARRVAKEDWKKQGRTCSLDNEVLTTPDVVSPDPLSKLESEEEPDHRLICFDHCLEGLSSESRNLILSYYQEDGRAKIDWRRQLAEQWGIPLNALRIRAHRIRKSLEQCIENCLAQRT
jgi:DNA-directed RNA polymerase specialized sigma24 family protein